MSDWYKYAHVVVSGNHCFLVLCYIEITVVILYLKFKPTQAHIDGENEEKEDRNRKFSRLLLPCFAWFVFIVIVQFSNF